MGTERERTARQADDYDRDFWEARWTDVLREHPEVVAHRPPNTYLTETAETLAQGRALDAGCGHGSEAIWLAAHGWLVTAVDFSAAALAHGRSTAEALGSELAERIDWVEADLAAFRPRERSFDLVTCLYVHVAGAVEHMVSRLADGVAPGGTLLLVGHLPSDPATGAESPAADQVQVTVEQALSALGTHDLEILVAEERQRSARGSGADAVVRARRRQDDARATAAPPELETSTTS